MVSQHVVSLALGMLFAVVGLVAMGVVTRSIREFVRQYAILSREAGRPAASVAVSWRILPVPEREVPDNIYPMRFEQQHRNYEAQLDLPLAA